MNRIFCNKRNTSHTQLLEWQNRTSDAELKYYTRGAELSNNEDIPSFLNLGIDVGSTTTKAVVLDPKTHEVLYHSYRRHQARQAQSVANAFRDVAERFLGSRFRVAISGSGSKDIATALNIPYVQEVVANSIAIQELHPTARCAIELGGQDAKMIFFTYDSKTDRLVVSDMRMNGSCAGGTGAFIDEIASLLKTPVEKFNDLASKGESVFNISGRCGVYAKTDIQPLLNQGVPKEDIALSSFHAIAKQTLGGLAQGLEIHPPVVFEGGPMTFNPRLIEVFCERLHLNDDQIIIPDMPETIVARGTALSLEGLFADEDANINLLCSAELLEASGTELASDKTVGKPFFSSDEELDAFRERHALPDHRDPLEGKPRVINAYLGIDSGSTTTKFALIDEDTHLIDEFYANNEGEPLDIAKAALTELREKYRAAGTELNILACGTTGYGELLFHRAFHADYHVVETVAHATAARKYVPDASFILDIGGQDMKAIWIDNGVVTDIVVNEACSSGCGSFLDNFGASLGIPTKEIATAAFRSKSPAVLGSRCTVFMTSSIVTEQKNGKTSDDIMAGLCRSIIENVFTKVIRVSNLSSLGDKVVVQGGTFNNDAVLRAFEQYIDKDVVRAPYPGLMGAIGAAMLAKQNREDRMAEGQPGESTFIGLDNLDDFSYERVSGVICPFCANRCNRTLMTFSDGVTWVTGNRCTKGEIIGDPSDETTRDLLRHTIASQNAVPDLFKTRQRLLFQDYPCEPLSEDRGITVGLPRVLAIWDTMPFWSTFLRALGFTVKTSRLSTRAMYENGLSAVASDTVCFPAKLVHGHLRELVGMGVDRIFMPVITAVEPENQHDTSESMCAVVKGYPLVIRNSDNPEEQFGVPFDSPLWHWHTNNDRDRQLSQYMLDAFGVPKELTLQAIAQADIAQATFRSLMDEAGREAIDYAHNHDTFAVVLASRPYHNDPLVNHDLPSMFTEMGLPVLTPDAVPGVREVDLSNSRIDVVNNYHARMLGSAVIAAQREDLEYVQLVSFGCGHDAYLSDEIIRLMKEVSGKTPLVVKVDESDIQGPLRIRARSFIETINMKRRLMRSEGVRADVHELQDSYPVKFTKTDARERVILVPNTSHAFSRLMAAVFSKQGVKALPLDIGRERAIELGKRYVHNDICFPAQIVIGEALAALESGEYDQYDVAIGTGKYIGDCRLTHYAALLRKALDDAGYEDVPIVTNDDVDFHNIHPGFKMSLPSAIRIAMTLPMIDILEELVRKMRPYELVPGAANAAFDQAMDVLMEGLEKHGATGATAGFKRAIAIMKDVPYDRSALRPSVLIVGEYLLNFHPGANHDIEDYLERNGLEVIEARMTDVIRKTYFYQDAQVKEYKIETTLQNKAWLSIANGLFERAHDNADRIAKAHPLYEPTARMGDLVVDSDPIIHHTFDAGEGVLIPGEILHHAKHGCRAFLILQPFGCLPNHIVGRGISKKLKQMYPDAQILPLDYDPDVSFANVENRLQMLIMNAREHDRVSQ